MPRGRKKGAKNVSKLWRELEKRMSKDIALDGVDPLHVIEWAMRYFFGLAQTGREAGAPLEEVRKCVREAAQLAGLAAPYRHPRLSAVKHIDNHELLEGVPADASAEGCAPRWPSASRIWQQRVMSILRRCRDQSQRPAPDFRQVRNGAKQ
jgi:hypothetical protein